MPDAAAAIRPYAAIFRARFSLLLQYRAAALAGFGTQCWWGAIKIMVLTAYFRGADTTPMSLRQAIDYVWLGQAFLTMIPWSVDPEIARMIRSGDVAYERLRPLDTYSFWYARSAARRTATPLLRAVPMVVTAGVLLPLSGYPEWGLSAPPNVEAALLFALSMGLVVALSSAIGTLMDVLTVATLSDKGVNSLAGPVIVIFSGSLVPLPLFPEWLQPLLRYQPFAGLLDTPLRIYGGHLPGLAAIAALARQAVWVVLLVLLGRALIAHFMAKIQVQGG
jgi:ABC-2 type transport system permease protein